MKSLGAVLSFLLILSSTISFAQKLKRADRQIVSNLKTYHNQLGAQHSEKQTAEYVANQFARHGLVPGGDSNSWYQQFEMYDGKHILRSGYFNINNHDLTLFEDYFPFPFSASKEAEGAVALALAENGYPWFKDISDIVSNPAESPVAIAELIRKRAVVAAKKGASALIVYNSSRTDLVFDSMDRSQAVDIPVIYLSKKGFKRYSHDESSTLEVKLKVELRDNLIKALNLIGFADHHADSTVLATASLGHLSNTATLLELVRLSASVSAKKKNFLFVALSPDTKGNRPLQHLKNNIRPGILLTQEVVDIDAMHSGNPADGLMQVKQGLEAFKSKSQR